MPSHRSNTILGWDIGGAHLKVALVDADGTALEVMQLPCPLWQGLEQLQSAVSTALDSLTMEPAQHAITMTGELADIFLERSAGVKQIADIMSQRLGTALRFYAGRDGWVTAAEIGKHTAAVASANWLASASFAASQIQDGLFVDIGSTTTDLVAIADGKPCPRGFTDAERMQYEELVYTGVVRTPLMALGPRVPFAGEWQTLAAEHFATTADVYRLTGDLREADDMSATADGAAKTLPASARRLARMIGRDLGDASLPAWIALAQVFKQQQVDRLKQAVLRCFSYNTIDATTPIVGAGAGRFLVRELARQLGHPYIDAVELVAAQTEVVRQAAALCLPAYAVARLSAGITDIKTAA
ncbi:MAG TPA: hydantoinase/oxoprolinase family protein [Methylophilaceae bacterium]|nr:hydantoinase/oxoprolinase family protein [Methylophilaceae bacterium]